MISLNYQLHLITTDNEIIFFLFRENSFVKVVGQLREYEGRKHVLIYDITPIVDWNELSHHLLQIIFIHLQNTKGPIPVRISSFRPFVLSSFRPFAFSFSRPFILSSFRPVILSFFSPFIFSSFHTSTFRPFILSSLPLFHLLILFKSFTLYSNMNYEWNFATRPRLTWQQDNTVTQ